MGETALALPGWRSALNDFWERTETKKARRVAFHVARAAKKFFVGMGNATWVTGTTVLVMVMPLVFEIDREQVEPGMLPPDIAAAVAGAK